MNLPSIDDYINALHFENALGNYSHLEPVRKNDGGFYFSSGNFAVVFKMRCKNTGKFFALKVFHRYQEGRIENYKLIDDCLSRIDSPFLVKYHFLEKEIWVNSVTAGEGEFPAIILDWVEGKTLGYALQELCKTKDISKLKYLVYAFDEMALWLLNQDFAHGDLKTDNILVVGDNELKLVDYDGLYTKAMTGTKASENGSPGFRHPKRDIDHFGPHIDDFAILLISLSLHTLAENPILLSEHGAGDSILFTESELSQAGVGKMWQSLSQHLNNVAIAARYALLHMACTNPANARIFGLENVLQQTPILQRDKIKEAKKHFVSGYEKGNNKDYQGEIEDYTKAIDLNPEYLDAYNNRGVAKRILKDFLGAIEDYNRAIELSPQFISAYLNRGVAKIEIQNYQEAIEDCNKVIELNPKHTSAYHNRGVAKKSLKDFLGAIEDYTNAIDTDLNYSLSFMNRGEVKNETKDYLGAIEDYTKAIELNPEYAKSYNNRGITKSSLKDYHGAIEDFTKAIELDSKYSSAFWNRAFTKNNLKDYLGAIEDYSKAIELNPKNSDSFNNRGVSKNKLKDHQGAIEDYSKAIELNPKYAVSFNNRGNAKDNLKDLQGAIEDYSKAIELDPSFLQAYCNRALVKKTLKNYTSAINDCEKVFEIDPDNQNAKAIFKECLELRDEKVLAIGQIESSANANFDNLNIQQNKPFGNSTFKIESWKDEIKAVLGYLLSGVLCYFISWERIYDWGNWSLLISSIFFNMISIYLYFKKRIVRLIQSKPTSIIKGISLTMSFEMPIGCFCIFFAYLICIALCNTRVSGDFITFCLILFTAFGIYIIDEDLAYKSEPKDSFWKQLSEFIKRKVAKDNVVLYVFWVVFVLFVFYLIITNYDR
jgi:tetratricopeptide (TPR) repeat protein